MFKYIRDYFKYFILPIIHVFYALLVFRVFVLLLISQKGSIIGKTPIYGVKHLKSYKFVTNIP